MLVGGVLPSVAATNDGCILTGESRGWGRGFVGGTLGTVCLNLHEPDFTGCFDGLFRNSNKDSSLTADFGLEKEVECGLD